MDIKEYLKQVNEREAKMKLKLEDVWGKDKKGGLAVAYSYDECPVFNDTVPYKSVTVVFDIEDEEEVCYWLRSIHGGSYRARKVLPDGKIAIRSDYQCW